MATASAASFPQAGLRRFFTLAIGATTMLASAARNSHRRRHERSGLGRDAEEEKDHPQVDGGLGGDARAARGDRAGGLRPPPRPAGHRPQGFFGDISAPSTSTGTGNTIVEARSFAIWVSV